MIHLFYIDKLKKIILFHFVNLFLLEKWVASQLSKYFVSTRRQSSIFMYRLIVIKFATRLSFARSLLQVIKGFFNNALLIALSPSLTLSHAHANELNNI